MRTAYVACACLALIVGCGETSEDPNNSVAEGGSAGTAGSAASGGSGGNAGASSGGSGNSGGNSGSGGSSSGGMSSGGSGGGTGPECVSAGDCELFSDCCNCLGVPKGQEVAGCDLDCNVDECSRQGVKEPQCIAGRCVTGYECDARNVACAAPTPACPDGQVPAVSGGCWTGGCVPAIECLSVTQCGDCFGANVACTTYETQLGPEYHCVEIPEGCAGAATCECMGPSVCVQGFNACQDLSGIKGVACGCPAC